MKKCKECLKEKKQSQFYGIQGECKECTKMRVKKNRLSNIEYYENYERIRQKYNLKRIFSHRYSGMLARIQGRATREYKVEGKNICKRDEFIKWCNSSKNLKVFNSIHEKWCDSGFKRNLTPSIDRIDNSKGYVLENIRWVSLLENCKKYNK